jgi:hypothetical protein
MARTKRIDDEILKKLIEEGKFQMKSQKNSVLTRPIRHG